MSGHDVPLATLHQGMMPTQVGQGSHPNAVGGQQNHMGQKMAHASESQLSYTDGSMGGAVPYTSSYATMDGGKYAHMSGESIGANSYQGGSFQSGALPPQMNPSPYGITPQNMSMTPASMGMDMNATPEGGMAGMYGFFPLQGTQGGVPAGGIPQTYAESMQQGGESDMPQEKKGFLQTILSPFYGKNTTPVDQDPSLAEKKVKKNRFGCSVKDDDVYDASPSMEQGQKKQSRGFFQCGYGSKEIQPTPPSPSHQGVKGQRGMCGFRKREESGEGMNDPMDQNMMDDNASMMNESILDDMDSEGPDSIQKKGRVGFCGYNRKNDISSQLPNDQGAPKKTAAGACGWGRQNHIRGAEPPVPEPRGGLDTDDMENPLGRHDSITVSEVAAKRASRGTCGWSNKKIPQNGPASNNVFQEPVPESGSMAGDMNDDDASMSKEPRRGACGFGSRRPNQQHMSSDDHALTGEDQATSQERSRMFRCGYNSDIRDQETIKEPQSADQNILQTMHDEMQPTVTTVYHSLEDYNKMTVFEDGRVKIKPQYTAEMNGTQAQGSIIPNMLPQPNIDNPLAQFVGQENATSPFFYKASQAPDLTGGAKLPNLPVMATLPGMGAPALPGIDGPAQPGMNPMALPGMHPQSLPGMNAPSFPTRGPPTVLGGSGIPQGGMPAGFMPPGYMPNSTMGQNGIPQAPVSMAGSGMVGSVMGGSGLPNGLNPLIPAELQQSALMDTTVCTICQGTGVKPKPCRLKGSSSSLSGDGPVSEMCECQLRLQEPHVTTIPDANMESIARAANQMDYAMKNLGTVDDLGILRPGKSQSSFRQDTDSNMVISRENTSGPFNHQGNMPLSHQTSMQLNHQGSMPLSQQAGGPFNHQVSMPMHQQDEMTLRQQGSMSMGQPDNTAGAEQKGEEDFMALAVVESPRSESEGQDGEIDYGAQPNDVSYVNRTTSDVVYTQGLERYDSMGRHYASEQGGDLSDDCEDEYDDGAILVHSDSNDGEENASNSEVDDKDGKKKKKTKKSKKFTPLPGLPRFPYKAWDETPAEKKLEEWHNQHNSRVKWQNMGRGAYLFGSLATTLEVKHHRLYAAPKDSPRLPLPVDTYVSQHEISQRLAAKKEALKQ